MIISNFPSGGGASKPEKKAFIDCSWAEVSAICKAGLASEYWAIGDTKPMIAGATSKILRIIGFNHDNVTDPEAYGREKAGITLEMVDQHSSLIGPMNDNNYSGTAWYHSSSMYHCKWRQTILPAFMASEMPNDLKNVLVAVDKEYNSDGATVSDTLFLLSLNELFGTYPSGAGSEGDRYDYYIAGNTVDRDVSYWTRSLKSGADWYYINTSGTVTTMPVGAAGAANIRGFPAMCI